MDVTVSTNEGGREVTDCWAIVSKGEWITILKFIHRFILSKIGYKLVANLTVGYVVHVMSYI